MAQHICSVETYFGSLQASWSDVCSFLEAAVKEAPQKASPLPPKFSPKPSAPPPDSDRPALPAEGGKELGDRWVWIPTATLRAVG
eukprot:9438424-Prorocentrum_lima.AAC.1